jgi:hypothetical protein
MFDAHRYAATLRLLQSNSGRTSLRDLTILAGFRVLYHTCSPAEYLHGTAQLTLKSLPDARSFMAPSP